MAVREEKAAFPTTLPHPAFWVWLLQRATAIVLIVALGAHLVVLHIVSLGEGITLERVADRLASPAFVALDIVLLAAALFHGFNGIRNIVTDFRPSRGVVAAVTWGLVVLGLALFIFGAYGLTAFLS